MAAGFPHESYVIFHGKTSSLVNKVCKIHQYSHPPVDFTGEPPVLKKAYSDTSEVNVRHGILHGDEVSPAPHVVVMHPTSEAGSSW